MNTIKFGRKAEEENQNACKVEECRTMAEQNEIVHALNLVDRESSLLCIIHPPALELKPLPTRLKYKFLGERGSLPVIISSKLNLTQEKLLMQVLKRHEGAIGWSLADIKGISPS
ncbi:MAG: hypothetical protein Q8835_02795 [Sweet potato little leaf phytoplasma]|nr:hypothetical protein [Sweet potato little leaf phytoplasma]